MLFVSLNIKVSDSSFERLSFKYETERDELKMKIKDIRAELSGIETMRQGTEQFTKVIRKFMKMETLSSVLLRELIEKIEVYAAEGQGRRKTQRIIIYYKFIGAIDIPIGSEYERLRRETRQGVEVEYITQTKSA